MKKLPIFIALGAFVSAALAGCGCSTRKAASSGTSLTSTESTTSQINTTSSVSSAMNSASSSSSTSSIPSIINYTVSFKNYDETLLSETVVEKGHTAVYNGPTPTRGETAEYTYTFKGWDQPLENITSDCVRVAQYTEILKPVTIYYTVTFKNYDGTVLYETRVKEGENATYSGATPTREETAEYSYTFKGWNQSLDNITSDRILIAQYNEIQKPITTYYKVTFKNYDGTVLQEVNVEEGKTAVYKGANPTRPNTPEFNYVFNGWDQSLENIYSNCTRVARYTQTYVEYTVEFYSYENQLLYTDVVHYQQQASYYGPIPTKPSTSTHTYTFLGWDKDLSCITKSITVKPIFDESGVETQLILNPNNGEATTEMEVIYDESYNLGTPSYVGFKFLGWYADGTTLIPTSGVWKYSNVTSVTAKWESIYYEFTENENTNSITLTGEGLTATEIVIPETYNGLPVTALGENFLKQNTTVEKIAIPGSIKTIPDYSFYYCTNLKEVVLNKGLITIGEHAFEGCKLTHLNIPSTCTTIGRSAFDNNKELYHVFIPKSVVNMGSYAFDVLNSSAYICIEHEATPSSWNSNWSSYTVYINSVKIVEGEDYTYVVKSTYGDLSVVILRLSEATSKLQSFTFPDDIEGITDIRVAQSLFYANKYIRNVNFNKVTRIASNAFYNCSNLQEVTFSNALTFIGSSAFRFCSSLTRVVIPESVTEIQSMAFDACTDLTYIYIPKTVVTIGGYAFDACNKSTIYTNAHSANSGWSSNFKGGQPIYYDFETLNELDDFTYVTQSYLGDKYVTITGVKASAKLKKNLIIPNEIEGISDIRLKGSLFNNLTELVSVDIGTGVKKIPDSCFAYCTKLETVTLHEGLTNVGGSAFYDCVKLSSISFPSSVTYIGKQAFDYCSGLNEVFIPISVSTIGSYAFDDTGRLSFFIEASVNQPGWDSTWAGTATGNKQFVYDYVSSGVIGDFKYAKASNGVTSTIYILGLDKDSTNVNLVVPNEIEGISNIKIMNYAFDANSIIKSVDLGSSVTYVGPYAFRNNISLRSVIIPLNCTVIKNNAFYGCSTQCVLNCEASEKPAGWDDNWNYSSCQVVWGYVRA